MHTVCATRSASLRRRSARVCSSSQDSARSTQWGCATSAGGWPAPVATRRRVHRREFGYRWQRVVEKRCSSTPPAPPLSRLRSASLQHPENWRNSTHFVYRQAKKIRGNGTGIKVSVSAMECPVPAAAPNTPPARHEGPGGVGAALHGSRHVPCPRRECMRGRVPSLCPLPGASLAGLAQ